MSLATRCTACGTIFRVVQDQLKVSEGWVRCGRCDAVFSAMEGLFDLERDVPPEWSGPGPTDEIEAVTQEPSNGPDQTTGRDADEDHVLDIADVHAPTAQEPQTEALLSVAPAGPGARAEEFSEFMASEQVAAPPDFIRHSGRSVRTPGWGSGWALGLSVILAFLVLGTQTAYHFRDAIAARWPQTKTTLQTACAWLACRVELPMRIEDLAVENTALTHTTPGSDAVKLSVNLRNRGIFVVALPSVDLSLTDASGQLVARRALTPTDFLAASPGLEAGAETTLSLMLTSSDKRVTGYTVEVFYP